MQNPFRHQYPSQHEYYYLEHQFNGNQFRFRYNRHQYHNILLPFRNTQPFYQNNYQNGGIEYQNDKTLVELLGDFLYIAPSDYVARLHSQGGGKVWLFAFEYEGTRSFGPIQKNAQHISKQTYGVSHMDDRFYAWITEYIRDSPAAERSLSNTYAKQFYVFTRLGQIPSGYMS
ncbi:unnamed protein product, partial [Oppiella nova]